MHGLAYQRIRQWTWTRWRWEDAKLDLEFDAKYAWNPRERVIIREAEDYLGRSGEILVEVGEIGGVRVVSNRCDRCVRSRGALKVCFRQKQKEGHLLADAMQCAISGMNCRNSAPARQTILDLRWKLDRGWLTVWTNVGQGLPPTLAPMALVGVCLGTE